MPGWLKFRGKAESPDLRFPKDASLHDVLYAVVDTELTSLDTRSNRLISIGAITMDDGTKIRFGEQFYRVVNPGVHVPAAGVLVHKLRPNDVEQGIPPADALAELRQFIEGKVLVGHFVHIDLNALRKELGDEQHQLSNPAIDTAHGRKTSSSRWRTSAWPRWPASTISTSTKPTTRSKTRSSPPACGRNRSRGWRG